jgi:hypothetical protein
MTSPNPAPDEAVREIALLIEEYDPKNSDWYFRRTVIREILNRLAAAKPPASGVDAVREALIEKLRSTPRLIHNPEGQSYGEGWISNDYAMRDVMLQAADYLASLSPAATSGSEAGGEAGAEHPDDLAVDRFAAAMKAKLAKKRAEGRGGWERKDECSNGFLSQLLREHIAKGDPVDVGNLAMMIHQRGERIG